MSVLLVKTTAELTALEGTATAGDTYFNSDTKSIRVWDGSVWMRYANDGQAPQFNTYSMQFNGSSSVLSPAATIAINSGSPKSISFWFRIDTTIPGNRNFCIFGNETAYRYGFIVHSTTAASVAGTGIASNWNSGQWYHMVIASSGLAGDLDVYRDGAILQAGLNDFPLNCKAIGASNSNQYWHEGLIDEFAVWNTKLNIQEVQEIYGSTNNRSFDLTKNTGNYVSKDNLLNFYRMGDFDINPSETITDLGLNSNNLSNTNALLIESTPY